MSHTHTHTVQKKKRAGKEQCETVSPPKKSIAPENGCLEDDHFSLGPGFLAGVKIFVSGSVI